MFKTPSLLALVILSTVPLEAPTSATTAGAPQAALSPLVYVYGRADFAASNSGIPAAEGDFNGYGRPDFVMLNHDTNTMAILLGQPDGSFKDSGVSYPVGPGPGAAAVGDFNGDGNLDVVVVNAVCPPNTTPCPDGSVSILLGKGDGTFQPPVDYATGPAPDAVAVGDFNGDGRLDLAVANRVSIINTAAAGTISILLGNGDGTFQPHVDYAAGLGVIGVVAGDFNGDGKLDLVVGNIPALSSTTLSLLLGNGDGTFKPPTTIQAGVFPLSLAAADLNGNGRLDLVVGGAGQTVSVILGNGDATFQAPVQYATGFGSSSVVIADLRNDGKLDLIVGGGGGFSVLLGNGDGTFQPHTDYVTGTGGVLGVGDFNRDGKLDVALVAGGTPGLRVTLGNGDGTFANPLDYLVGNGPSAIITADFNGDDKPDLAVANSGDNTVSILLGNGNGTFSARTDYSVGANPAALVAGDFNGNGKLDLAVVNAAGNSVSVLLGNGDGTFQPAKTSATGAHPQGIVAGDFNSDGKLDLAVTNAADNTVSILLGNGDGTFQSHVDYATGPGPTGLVAGDFNGDGKLDLAIADSGTPWTPPAVQGVVSVLLGNGDGTFQTHVDYPVGLTLIPTALAVADFNGDGKADLAVSIGIPDPEEIASLTVLLGNGDGTFQAGQTYPYYVGWGATAVTVSDFNADGKLDVGVPTSGTNIVTLLKGVGDGTFQSQGVYGTATGLGPTGVAFGDFDGDGYPDMAVAYAGSNRVSIYLSTSASPSPIPDFAIASPITSARITAGQTATYTVNLSPMNGFNGTVTMGCSGAPPLATCSISPSSVSLNGSSTASVTVSVATTAGSTAMPRDPGFPRSPRTGERWFLILSTLYVLAILGLLDTSRRLHRPGTTRRNRAAPSGFANPAWSALLLLLLSVASCGGGSSTVGSNPGTPPGTYTLTVTGASSSGSGTVQHSITLTLTVR